MRVAPDTLRGWIMDGAELAILDAREEGEFGASHLFWAVPCPFSRRELRARALLPRLGTRVVCVDDGRGVAERLAAYLASIGCTEVSVLDGGTAAWAAAGHVLFSGVNVPSKAFGEWVEHEFGTESVDAPELRAWLDDGRDMVVLDSRTLAEFGAMSIPRGRSVPGGELAYRIAELAPDPRTLVVVNCAGRTRSILGAESLRQAGVPNRTVALRNGTMGWELAGLECEHGSVERFAPGRPASAGLALQRATAFTERSGVRVIDSATLAAFERDGTRSLHVLDVRDPAEFGLGTRLGAVSAPGGQLVQATDNWIAVRGARVVLIDDDGARARMAASWLRLMGHRDVFVADGALEDIAPLPPAAPGLAACVPEIDVAGLAASGACVIDLSRSLAFRAGHIPGAIWAVRSRLAGVLPLDRPVVLTCPDGALARLTVAEAQALTGHEVRALTGGNAAWRDAGRELAVDRAVPDDDACVDVHLRPYDRNSGVAAAMNAYLSWEIDLVHEIVRDGTVRFGAPCGSA